LQPGEVCGYEEGSATAQGPIEQVTTLRVAGMDCADEVEAIQRVLKPVAGIREFKVSLMAGNVTIGNSTRSSSPWRYQS